MQQRLVETKAGTDKMKMKLENMEVVSKSLAPSCAEKLFSLSAQRSHLRLEAANFVFNHVRVVKKGLFRKGVKEARNVTLLYRASEHGWSVPDFHRHCNISEVLLFLVRSSKGYLAAGFYPYC